MSRRTRAGIVWPSAPPATTTRVIFEGFYTDSHIVVTAVPGIGLEGDERSDDNLSSEWERYGVYAVGDAARGPADWRNESMDPRASAHQPGLDLDARLGVPRHCARRRRIGCRACRCRSPRDLGFSRGGLVSSAGIEKPALNPRQSP